jgi:hypothetical protein
MRLPWQPPFSYDPIPAGNAIKLTSLLGTYSHKAPCCDFGCFLNVAKGYNIVLRNKMFRRASGIKSPYLLHPFGHFNTQ